MITIAQVHEVELVTVQNDATNLSTSNIKHGIFWTSIQLNEYTFNLFIEHEQKEISRKLVINKEVHKPIRVI